MNHNTASYSSASIILQAASTKPCANSRFKNQLSLTSRTEVVDKPTATIVGYNELGKIPCPSVR